MLTYQTINDIKREMKDIELVSDNVTNFSSILVNIYKLEYLSKGYSHMINNESERIKIAEDINL